MSVSKQIKASSEPLYSGLNKIAFEIHNSLLAFSNKLDDKNKVTFAKRIVVVRNWLTHFLLWLILALLLSSCFVTGRNVRMYTPHIEISADTATAFTWPYNTKFQ